MRTAIIACLLFVMFLILVMAIYDIHKDNKKREKLGHNRIIITEREEDAQI